jgi:predicted SnoaL-like aldol condensation-catalyzing enzyme
MLRRTLAAFALCSLAAPALAQEPVVGVANPESLFTDKDPAIHRNKQAALHIMRELLQCNHWSDAGNWLTSRYIQHNPNVISGLDPVIKYFSTRPRTEPCGPLKTPVVAVLAEGDLVAVVISRTLKHPADPAKTYTTSWFDMWRFVDGKADEHWDGAELAPPRPGTPANGQ